MLRHSPEFFKRLFETLDNNSVLMQVEDDGTYYPVWCSADFCKMMEGTQEDFIRLESGGTMNTIHPDDREAISYLFKHHHAPDGTNALTVRKYTVKGNLLWVCIHYAFMKEKNIQYAYCSYFDVTDLKESQEQTQIRYDELNRELNILAEDSLAVIRSNLTTGRVEKIYGYDIYDCDKVGAKSVDLIKCRLENMPLQADREKYTKIFDLEKLKIHYYKGGGPISSVIFSRRQSGRQCFIKYSASIQKNPLTGDMIALGIETEYNSEKVTEVLNNKVLSKQYDMVCYIVDGSYGVVIGDKENIKVGSIFPNKKTGNYTDEVLRLYGKTSRKTGKYTCNRHEICIWSGLPYVYQLPVLGRD